MGFADSKYRVLRLPEVYPMDTAWFLRRGNALLPYGVRETATTVKTDRAQKLYPSLGVMSITACGAGRRIR